MATHMDVSAVLFGGESASASHGFARFCPAMLARFRVIVPAETELEGRAGDLFAWVPLKLAKPLPTWMEISAVFLSPGPLDCADDSIEAVVSKLHCMATVHFSGTLRPHAHVAFGEEEPGLPMEEATGESGEEIVFGFLVPFLRGLYL